MQTSSVLYPEIEPRETGMLDVGDGHSIYFERVGKEGGKPAVFLHGGPGGGISTTHRRLFNPECYDLLLFDQRGCGNSTPHAELNANTTWHLVSDIERLRALVGAEKWLVFGGSWGSTLALAYAQKHPERVSELILRGVYLLTKAELDWYYQFGVSEIFPELWERFVEPVGQADRGNMIEAYHCLLSSDDDDIRNDAAQRWAIWEGSTITLLPDAETSAPFRDGHYAWAFARIENHFFRHGGWLREGQLLEDADRLAEIPGMIVHGRYDMPCPARYAYALHKRWPKSVLNIIEGAGHAYSEPGILKKLIEATDFYSRNHMIDI
jgi:proline iminopeptidase